MVIISMPNWRWCGNEARTVAGNLVHTFLSRDTVHEHHLESHCGCNFKLTFVVLSVGTKANK